MFWGDLPLGTEIDLYLPTVDMDELLRVASYSPNQAGFRLVDDATLRLTHRHVTSIPVLGGGRPIPCLVSVQLPEGVTAGERYHARLSQVSGTDPRRVVGSVGIEIPVRHDEDIVAFETHKLSVLRYIAEQIPSDDLWWRVFDRYVDETMRRVRSFGVDPTSVAPQRYVRTRRPRPADDDPLADPRRVRPSRLRELLRRGVIRLRPRPPRPPR